MLQEKILEEEEAEAQFDMQLAQEAAHAKMARDTSNDVCKNFRTCLRNQIFN